MKGAAAPNAVKPIRVTKGRRGDVVAEMDAGRKTIVGDFWSSMSAAELVRLQGVQPICKLGQIRTFSEPDEAEAEWFAREVRRWRNEGRPRAVLR